MKCFRPAPAVLIAVAFVSLMGAAMASASQFRSEAYPVSVEGVQTTKQKLVTTGGTVRCETAKLSATLSAPSASLLAAPTYGECTAYGFAGATVSANSCKYSLDSTNEAAPFTGTMSIVCSKEGDAIEVHAGNCTTSLRAQTALASLSFENSGSGAGRTILATWNVSGITYTESAGCFNPGTRSNGTYTGSIRLGAKSGSGQTYGMYLANAQAGEGPQRITAERYPAFVKAEAATSMKLSGNFGAMSCAFSGGVSPTFSGPVNPITWSSGWQSCVLNGISTYVVETNGCSLQLEATPEPQLTGHLGVSCANAGESIALRNGSCVITIPTQTGQSVTIENNGTGSGRYISTQPGGGQSLLTYTVSGSCSFASGTYSNGSLTGTWALHGFDQSLVGQGIWLA